MRALKSDIGSKVTTGKILIWNEAKGFGWVESGDQKLFFHSREFVGQAFEVGQELSYMVGSDIKGRPCARSPEGAAPVRISVSAWMLLVALMVLPVMGLTHVPVPWWWPTVQVIALSAATYRLYSYDKRQAVRRGWRVPETSLHLAEIAGGWPGAFLAQRRLRHKVSKGRYLAIYWCIISLHQLVGLDFYLDNRLSGDLWKMMGEGKVFGG